MSEPRDMLEVLLSGEPATDADIERMADHFRGICHSCNALRAQLAAKERECEELRTANEHLSNKVDSLESYIREADSIPADAHLPIDAAWLREVWGYVQPWKGQERRFCLPDYTMDIVHAYDDQWYATWIDSKHWNKPITTRHQFMQLMTALGIQPQPPKVKE